MYTVVLFAFPLLCIAFIVLIAIAVRSIFRKNDNQTGTIALPDGTGFSYELGTLDILDGIHGLLIHLPHIFPSVLVDSHSNDKLGTSMIFDADQSQRLELEGDFYKRFSIYAPKGYEQLMLELLTPDVMALLMDESGAFDLEIYGDELYFYSWRDPRTDNQLDTKILDVATRFLTKKQALITRWVPDTESNTADMLLTGRGQLMHKLGRHAL